MEVLDIACIGLQKRERKEGIKNELYFRIYVVGITPARKP